jgi:hypothetical protein
MICLKNKALHDSEADTTDEAFGWDAPGRSDSAFRIVAKDES